MNIKNKLRTIYTALLLVGLFVLFAPKTDVAAASAKTIRSEKTMAVGTSFTMKVSSNADYIEWSSSNKKIASVSSGGKVTAKKRGTATIRAKAVINGTTVIYKCTVKVITQQDSYIKETITRINKERRKYGLPSFNTNIYLQKAAQKRAQEIAQHKFSKLRPNGTSFTSAISMKYDFSYAAQSIAYDCATPKDVVKAWMANSGTKANVISKRYADIGVGVYLSEDGYLYWVSIYGRKK